MPRNAKKSKPRPSKPIGGDVTALAPRGTADGDAMIWDAATESWQPGAAGGTPGGADGELQYNNAGTFDGTTGIEFDGTDLIFAVGVLLKFIDSDATIEAPSAGILELAAASYVRIQVANPGDMVLGADGFNIYPETHKGTGIGDSGTYYGSSYISAITLLAGTGVDTATAGGTVYAGTAAVGNVGAGEDDLMSYSVPANSLSGDGMHIKFRAAGTIANNANAKRIRVKWGATPVTLFDTGAMPTGAAIDWSIEGLIIRISGGTQKAITTLHSNNATLNQSCDYVTASETLTNALTLKLTGEAVSNNDIVQEIFVIDWGSN